MPPLPVQVVDAVERQDVPLSMDLVGSTLGTQDVPIRARVEGFLETMDFEEGRFVRKAICSTRSIRSRFRPSSSRRRACSPRRRRHSRKPQRT